jgi:hypothetical protein
MTIQKCHRRDTLQESNQVAPMGPRTASTTWLQRSLVWPECWNDGGHPLLHDNDTPVFLISVGVHCTTNEPIHPTLSKNPKYYSHKHKATCGIEI